MANLTTNADLIDNILDRAGEPIDGTSDFESQALDYLNRAYRALWMGGNEFIPDANPNWWWLKAEGTFQLTPANVSGAVAVTLRDANIVLSTSASTGVDFHFKTVEHSDVFKIESGSGVNWVLDADYTGDTNAAADFVMFKIDHTFDTAFLRLIGPLRTYRNGVAEIGMVDKEKLQRDYPLNNIVAGIPNQFAPISEVDGITTIRFNKYISTEGTSLEGNPLRVDYDYLRVPSDLANDSNAPLIPIQYRYILTDMALSYLWQQKNDDRTNGAVLSAKAGITAMINENAAKWRAGFQQSLVLPRPKGRFGRVLRTESGKIIG